MLGIHGSYRRKVAGAEALDPDSAQAARRSRSALARLTRSAQQHLVDPPNGDAVEGSSAAVPFIPDVPSANPAVAERRSSGSNPHDLARDLEQHSKLDLTETLIDDSFAATEKERCLEAHQTG